MRAIFFLLIIALVAFAFFWKSAKAIDYEPMAEGDEWTINIHIVSPQGEKTLVAHRKVEGPVTQNGKTYFSVRTATEGKQGSIELVRKDATAVYSIDQRQPNATEQIAVMLPIKVGQTWDRISPGDTARYTVLGLEPVTVNDKTYENCFHIQSKGLKTGSTQDDWEAPNIGTIKSDVHYANGGRMTLTVTEFKRAR